MTMSNDAHPILIKTAINMINQKLDDKLISSVTGLSGSVNIFTRIN